MSVRVRVDVRELQRLTRQFPEQIDRVVAGAAEAMLTEIVQSFNTSPDGAEYQRGGVMHVASMPGYPPNIDVGALSRGMRVRQVGTAHYEIVDAVEYGVYLELGTENMEARPFVSPVFEDWGNGEFGRFIGESELLK